MKITKLAPLAEAFLAYAKSTVAEKTHENYTATMKEFGAYLSGVSSTAFESVPLIDRPMVQNYMFHLLGTRGWAITTVDSQRVMLSRFFNWCVDVGHLSANPMKGIKGLVLPEPTRDAFTPEEYENLKKTALRNCHSYWLPAIIIGYHTALRLTDVATFKISYIDWANETITLIAHKNLRKNKALEIPIESTELFPVLRSLVDNPSDHYLAEEGFLLPAMAMEWRTSRHRTLGAQFSVLRDKAGTRKLGFHCLRHTFASRLINSGVDCLVVSSITGHSDLADLQKYAHVNLARKRIALGAGLSKTITKPS